MVLSQWSSHFILSVLYDCEVESGEVRSDVNSTIAFRDLLSVPFVENWSTFNVFRIMFCHFIDDQGLNQSLNLVMSQCFRPAIVACYCCNTL